MLIEFFVRFSTRYGQSLWVTGNNDVLGNGNIEKAFPLQYFNSEYWYGSVDIVAEAATDELNYHYILKEETGNIISEWGNDRIVFLRDANTSILTCCDTWNHAGEIDNAFYTKAFQEILLARKEPIKKTPLLKKATHEFRIKAPLLKADEVICICGPSNTPSKWSPDKPAIMQKVGNWFVVRLDLSKENFPVNYRYGIYNTTEKKLVYFENGNSRTLGIGTAAGRTVIIHDGFAILPNNTWKAAGVAIPVFSLKTKNSFGSGEFADIKVLVDWAKLTGLKMIQLLPLNDTTATHSIADSYPYAAISAFALHPMFLNLDTIAGKESVAVVKALSKKQIELNASPVLDYGEVMKYKLEVLKKLYLAQKEKFKNDTAYFLFFEMNRHWLVPYAAFCFLRDKYGTSDFTQWKKDSQYEENTIQRLVSPDAKHYDEIALHYFMQYHLHLQLKDATSYAHKNGIVVKGDIPIGVYRFGCDAWTDPELYHMESQAGAPPDDFAVKGQNWEFPTYNWKKMQEDGFAWWRKRFEQMGEYFDAFRIDHILGFFRIWSIPLSAVEGIMGKFVPAIPVYADELYNRNIGFDYNRYCKPFINDQILNELFGNDASFVKDNFIDDINGNYQLKESFDTQRKIEAHFSVKENDGKHYLTEGLYKICSNVILFEEEGSNQTQFHFRFGMEQTSSFAWLNDYAKQQLKELYVNYFFNRQDQFWKTEAMQKLPGLKSSTNMLVCGEDLGMVPHCVPDVMRQLGILSLEIQRMPKETTTTEFFHPNDAPYMSVVTPGTHDMSTIRGWWEEDPAKTQRFFNQMLGHYGAAPFYCEPWVNKEIIVQHLYSPAMWTVFQLQDLLGISPTLRREHPADERINIPSDPKHFWVYRMHLYLEDLIKETAFNEELKGYIEQSGR